ncbi:MAG: alkaline phosphatase family protein [Sphingomonadales bacterium]|nr:MAG: alkaline phosphatase family protein [Sphingomonadales bacterium]
MRLILLLAAALALLPSAAGAQSAPPAVVQQARETVTILISLDGFRPDYITAERTPNLKAAADAGVFAAMRPSFPTMTFPNHYTLVTGLRPDRHGIVDNNIEDPAKPGVRFEPSAPKVTRDRFWWDQAEPIWVSAEKENIRTGTMFWPGSDSDIRGQRPRLWWAYDAAITSRQRTDTVLDWLRRPADRPRFVTLYFDVVDKASHSQGLYSAELDEAVRALDVEVGYLRGALAAMGQPANLVIVSDHGMAAVPPAQQMKPADLIDETLMRTIVAGPMVYIWPNPGSEAAAEARVLKPHPHAQCWRKEALPARFHYGRNARVAPLLCMSETGWRYNAWAEKTYVMGDHGFDNQDPQMRALFIAVGPAFSAGRTLPVFDNVDVYPLLRRLIGLPAASDIDGSDAVFAPVLARRSHAALRQ